MPIATLMPVFDEPPALAQTLGGVPAQAAAPSGVTVLLVDDRGEPAIAPPGLLAYYVRSTQVSMSSDEHGLGPLEMQILGLLDGAPKTSVQAIQEALAREGNDLAYTTVMTVLGRLHDKRLVVRAKDGRRYLYGLGKRAPAVTRGLVSRIQRALFPSDRTRPILALLDDDSLSEAELRELRAKIDERLRGTKA